MTDLSFSSARDWLDRLARREVSSVELVDHCLARIERHHAVLNAVVTLDAERAREAAVHADSARARGAAIGALHGLPMTIKDCFETAGLRTTCGNPALSAHLPERDADSVARLRAAGAIVLGKTNLPLMAGDWQTDNAVFGRTTNPWDASRAPGGSSGGAAAALAAGLVPLELGSDIGGSIRIPSNWCGVCGHKSTWGILPGRGHIPPLPGALAETDLGVFGPMARTVGDLELALGVLAGPSEAAAVAWTFSLPPARSHDGRALRVAAWLNDPAFPLDASVAEVLGRALLGLRGAGARIDERARPQLELADAVRTYMKLLAPIITADFPQPVFDAFSAAASTLPADADDSMARMIRFGTERHRDWMLANEARAQVRARMAAFFRDHDVLLLPVTIVPAISHDMSEPMPARLLTVNGAPRPYFDLMGWIALATMAYLPATVVPVGRTAQGLPVGLQIVGPWLEDRTTLAFARFVEQTLGGFVPPPGFA